MNTVLRPWSNYDDSRTMGPMTDTLTHPSRADFAIETVLAALADPVRLRIVRELARIGCDGIACGAIELPVT